MRTANLEEAVRRVLERAAKNGTVDYHDQCMQQLEYALQDREMSGWMYALVAAIPFVVLLTVWIFLTSME